MSQYSTVADFIEEFRDTIGDTTREIPAAHIISTLNIALRRLAREKGLDKLFRFQDSFDLASMNVDGSSAASWTIDMGSMVIDIESLLVLDSSNCSMCPEDMCYLPYSAFRKTHPFPEAAAPGSPSTFTLNQIGGKTKIIFNRPISRPHAVDMFYTAFHPRIRREEDIIRIPYGYLDIITEAVKIFYFMESADFASARALYEDYDKLTSEARELLAQQHSGLGYRKIRRSF